MGVVHCVPNLNEAGSISRNLGSFNQYVLSVQCAIHFDRHWIVLVNKEKFCC